MFLIDSDRVRACLIDPGRFLPEALSLGEDGRGRGAASVVRFMDIEYGCGVGWGKGFMSQLEGAWGVGGRFANRPYGGREVGDGGGWGGEGDHAMHATRGS